MNVRVIVRTLAPRYRPIEYETAVTPGYSSKDFMDLHAGNLVKGGVWDDNNAYYPGHSITEISFEEVE